MILLLEMRGAERMQVQKGLFYRRGSFVLVISKDELEIVSRQTLSIVLSSINQGNGLLGHGEVATDPRELLLTTLAELVSGLFFPLSPLPPHPYFLSFQLRVHSSFCKCH